MAIYSGSDKRIKYLFENGGGGGSSTLAGLSDVNLSSPTDGQVLTYDNGEWVNANGGSGGSGGMCYLNTIYSTTEKKVGYWTDGKPLYQKTWNLSPDIEITSSGVLLPSYVSNDLADAENIIWAVAERERNGSSILPAIIHAYVWNSSTTGTAYSVLSADRWSNVSKITIQYTKTTDSAEPNPQQGGVIYLPTIYSEEEREVGVWVDGKPLYQKTLYFATEKEIPGSWYQTDIDISAYNFEHIVFCVGANYDGSYQGSFLASWSGNYLMLMATRNSSAYINYLTIQYTKTTDTAGSGSWTPSGTPAVHYSLTEQVVGTWVDGSTLYERTYFLDNISSSATEYVVDNSFGNNKTMHSMDVQFSGMTNTLGKYINSISDTLYVDSGALKYYIYKTDSWWNALNSCYITIRYTKSS